MPDAALIICPMRAEADRLGRVPGARVLVSGPGPAAMRRFAASLPVTDGSDRGRLVILAGVAGGLVPDAHPGQARMVTRVLGSEGQSWSPPPLRSGPPPAAGWTVFGSDDLVPDAAAKRALADRHGAEIVDMESHVFAEIASRRGWSWVIARGVSDGVDDALPEDLLDMMDAEGRPRIGRSLQRIMARPALIPTLWRLATHTRLAMGAVRTLLLPIVSDRSS